MRLFNGEARTTRICRNCGELLLTLVTVHRKSCCELWKSFCNMLHPVILYTVFVSLPHNHIRYLEYVYFITSSS
jgi:protein-arginine kinase activator protein McsA